MKDESEVKKYNTNIQHRDLVNISSLYCSDQLRNYNHLCSVVSGSISMLRIIFSIVVSEFGGVCAIYYIAGGPSG